MLLKINFTQLNRKWQKYRGCLYVPWDRQTAFQPTFQPSSLSDPSGSNGGLQLTGVNFMEQQPKKKMRMKKQTFIQTIIVLVHTMSSSQHSQSVVIPEIHPLPQFYVQLENWTLFCTYPRRATFIRHHGHRRPVPVHSSKDSRNPWLFMTIASRIKYSNGIAHSQLSNHKIREALGARGGI